MDRNAEALRTRIAELESENALLRKAGAVRRRPGVRGAMTAIALVLCAILAPVAVLGGWARAQLVDTDRFVSTFAPLAEAPEVQELVAAETMDAIEQHTDIDGVVTELFDGLATLDLPPRAQAVLPLLERPAAEGFRSVVYRTVDGFVESPAFATIWETALRESHTHAVALLQDGHDGALELSRDGALSLELGTVVAAVKSSLEQNGIGIAEAIPEVDRAIPLVASDALALVETVYRVAVAAGYWLPWLVVGLLAVGISLARRRTRAVLIAALGVAAALALLAAGLGIGRGFFLSTVSPSVMPAATAGVIFDQITAGLSRTLGWLIALFAVAAAAAWIAGTSRAATALRALAGRAAARVRDRTRVSRVYS